MDKGTEASTMANERKTVAVLYGGKSTEHEISLLTAFSVINAINLKRYRVLPVYINQDGRWIPGSEITGKLSQRISCCSTRTLKRNARWSTGLHRRARWMQQALVRILSFRFFMDRMARMERCKA
ncbi:D-alanine-D-alanine ligase A [Sporolactobacillus inulinus]|uniref:D-alanine-D-alanine ligase A n=1 Tax=Sporolactobacillus inulinus TaxID=2078 RepID=A0A4Y1ZES8_9BACL|nr:D-alanine-D-alanine ligase A [Sporolactobacillus inulinus]